MRHTGDDIPKWTCQPTDKVQSDLYKYIRSNLPICHKFLDHDMVKSIASLFENWIFNCKGA